MNAQSLAHWVGSNMLTVLVTALTLVSGVILLGRVAQHHAERLASAGALRDQRILLGRMAAGIALQLAAFYLFSEMLEALDTREEMALFDTALADTLRLHLAPMTLRTFAWLTQLGDGLTLSVLCVFVAIVLWRDHRGLAYMWIAALAGNGLLNAVLKRVFERARPVHVHTVAVSGGGWSFPSGHSSGAVVAYGMLAYILFRFVPGRWQLPIMLAAAALVLTVGASRAMLQVHYASDVLAGFASGTIWLTLCIGACEWLRVRGGLAGRAPG